MTDHAKHYILKMVGDTSGKSRFFSTFCHLPTINLLFSPGKTALMLTVDC